jgi:POT family proton-dependent oligopeptide transporter
MRQKIWPYFLINHLSCSGIENMDFQAMKLKVAQTFSGFNSIYLTQPLFNAGFYGLKYLFVLYAIDLFSMAEAKAIALFATFMTLCYATSLVGGYLADQGLGVKNAVILGGTLMSLGLGCILIPSEDLCFLGLALMSLGSGFFKPNLLTAVGLTFENPKDPKKDRAYSIVYIAGNVGTFIIPTLCGFIGKIYGWHYGILLVVGIFISATYLFYKTMRFHPSYKQPIPSFSQNKLWGIILSLVSFLYLLFKYRASFHGMMGIIACGSIIYLGKIVYQCRGQERKDVLSIIFYILLFALFATLFEQAGTSLLLFLEKAVDRNVMGVILPSSAILSLEPLFVLACGFILLPLSSRYLEKAKPIPGLIKAGCGFLFAALSFWILALGTYQGRGASIPLLWIVGAIFLQTLGELWVVPISLSRISQYSPPRLQSVLMSFWPMAIAWAHYFGGFIAQFSIKATHTPGISLLDDSLERYRTFFFSLGFMPLVVGALILLYHAIKRRMLIKAS